MPSRAVIPSQRPTLHGQFMQRTASFDDFGQGVVAQDDGFLRRAVSDATHGYHGMHAVEPQRDHISHRAPSTAQPRFYMTENMPMMPTSQPQQSCHPPQSRADRPNLDLPFIAGLHGSVQSSPSMASVLSSCSPSTQEHYYAQPTPPSAACPLQHAPGNGGLPMFTSYPTLIPNHVNHPQPLMQSQLIHKRMAAESYRPTTPQADSEQWYPYQPTMQPEMMGQLPPFGFPNLATCWDHKEDYAEAGVMLLPSARIDYL